MYKPTAGFVLVSVSVKNLEKKPSILGEDIIQTSISKTHLLLYVTTYFIFSYAMFFFYFYSIYLIIGILEGHGQLLHMYLPQTQLSSGRIHFVVEI